VFQSRDGVERRIRQLQASPPASTVATVARVTGWPDGVTCSRGRRCWWGYVSWCSIRCLADALIFDLFNNKLQASKVYEAPALPSATAPVYRVDADTPFNELGLDSLDLVELMVAVEKEFHVELADEEHSSVKNVEDIIQKIHGHPSAY
jgi:acyl carrier protein